MDKRSLAAALFRIGALRFGRFTLTSGKSSSYYLDLRIVPSYPEVYASVIDSYRALADTLGPGGFDAVAGVATAGLAFASPLAMQLGKPMVYVRSDEKSHGLGRRVEGALRPSWRALVVDDLATTGGSILSAVRALRSQGCEVGDAAVLVDRLEGGAAKLEAAGVKLWACVTVEEMLESLLEEGEVTKKDYEAALRQMRSGELTAD
ncbi:MAG: orotate phosphoribosyltransferase [Nitrososphaerales archaeon]|nr:orotate phosphoribosyltransferase [Nitrososphaerales archaeon]